MLNLPTFKKILGATPLLVSALASSSALLAAAPTSTAPRSTATTPASSPVHTTTAKSVAAADGFTTVFRSDGSIDATAYMNYATSWNSKVVSQRLGPTYEALNSGVHLLDTRVANYSPTSKTCTQSFSNRTNPYELGPAGGCTPDTDYWSESGQVAYVPDNALNDPGLDRIQTFAYYNNVFALSPRLDYASGKPHPEPQTQDSGYKKMLGGFLPSEPVAMVRDYSMLQNEALVIYIDGLLGVAGTQTSRSGSERPYPGLVLAPNKVPTGIAITSSNEFALVTVMDTATLKGQLAVFALEAKFLPFHTWPYMGLPNQGSWSDFKLLGYIDLGMAVPSSVAAASNSYWNGPSQTGGHVLSQIDLKDASTRKIIYTGQFEYKEVVADKGYAIVTSKMENKAVVVDLSPLFQYVRDSYLSSADSFQKAVSTRGDGTNQFPLTFSEKPEIAPRVVWSQTYTAPSALLAGQHTDRWSTDRHKAYIACEDGTIHVLDTSAYMSRFSFEKTSVLSEIGSFKVGRNPVSMAFARFIEYPLPLLPNGSDGKAQRADPLNNNFFVACRGDREVDAVITYNGQGQVYRRITDSRMGDPVAVSMALRGPILSVADFTGKKILSFRMSGLTDRHNRHYGMGADGNAAYEYTGQMSFSGNPIAINTTNVN